MELGKVSEKSSQTDETCIWEPTKRCVKGIGHAVLYRWVRICFIANWGLFKLLFKITLLSLTCYSAGVIQNSLNLKEFYLVLLFESSVRFMKRNVLPESLGPANAWELPDPAACCKGLWREKGTCSLKKCQLSHRRNKHIPEAQYIQEQVTLPFCAAVQQYPGYSRF